MADYFLFNRLIISLCILPCLSMAAYADDVNEQISDAPVVVLQTIDTGVKMNANQNLSQENPEDNRWFDRRHRDGKKFLGRTAHFMDDWFGKTDPNKPARAQIRVMTDIRHNEYDGTTIKPRIRAKVKLPTLERQLSVIIVMMT